MTDTVNAPAVAGTPRLLLRLEGAALAFVALFLYPRTGETWLTFALLILAPDLSFLGYLAGPRAGAFAYNAFHVTIGPFALVLVGLVAPSATVVAIGLTWLGHVGFDRMLGYGLKYGTGFGHTHLGRIGKQPNPS